MLRFSSVWVASTALLVLGAAGCGPATRQEVPTVAVSGNVTLDGRPLSDAEINFVGAAYAGIAKTDSSGNYQLKAQPGENKIYFNKFEGAVDPTMLGGDTAAGLKAGPKQLIPKQYASAEASKTTFTVPDKDTTGADFQLKSR